MTDRAQPQAVAEVLPRGLPKPLTDDELDELCVHCNRRRIKHRWPHFRCVSGGTTFEGSGHYGEPSRDEAFARALRRAERNGFVPLWRRDGALVNEGDMWRMARRPNAS